MLLFRCLFILKTRIKTKLTSTTSKRAHSWPLRLPYTCDTHWGAPMPIVESQVRVSLHNDRVPPPPPPLWSPLFQNISRILLSHRAGWRSSAHSHATIENRTGMLLLSNLCSSSTPILIRISRQLRVQSLRLRGHILPQNSTCIARCRRWSPLPSRTLSPNRFSRRALAHALSMLDPLLTRSSRRLRTRRWKNFTACAFEEHASSLAVNIKSIPVEALHSISTIERYNTPVRKANRIV